MDGKYIDRPGVDLAQVVKDGRMYPVTMTIPISGEAVDGQTSAPPVPGFDIPSHDTVTMTEDANGKLLTVAYSLGGDVLNTLTFTYSGYVPVGPNTTTTIVKS
jgi:hypothetical protein